MPKTILSYNDWLNWVSTVTKTRQDNNVIDHTDVVYIENETELSWLIGLGTSYDENQIAQWRDR